MNIERRSFSQRAELRATPGALPILSGYAAVFGVPSNELSVNGRQFREVVRPGAFLRSLADALSGSHDILARYEHGEVIARTSNGTLRLKEDERGLRYEIAPADTQTGRDLVALVRRGDVPYSSFSFVARRDRWGRQSNGLVRELLDVKLIDVSPVALPAYPQTSAKVWLPGALGAMQRRLQLAEAQA